MKLSNLTWKAMGNHKMWNIWKTAGRRAKRMKYGVPSPRNSTCKEIFLSGHLSSVWGHSVHFEKFLLLRFSKGCCSPSFHPASTKPYKKHVFGQNTRYNFFWLFAKFIYGTLKISYLSYTLPVSIKLCWFNLAKGQAGCQGPWASCLIIFVPIYCCDSYNLRVRIPHAM